jgi:hypothetical protein
VKLPDGRVLTYDLFTSIGANGQYAGPVARIDEPIATRVRLYLIRQEDGPCRRSFP